MILYIVLIKLDLHLFYIMKKSKAVLAEELPVIVEAYAALRAL